MKPIQHALISVFNKEGLRPLAQSLQAQGATLYSTGGSGKFLRESAQVDYVPIDKVTQFPEMMDGRVKTLHPRIFGGLLARRDTPNDLQEAEKHQIPLFDLVVVNFYAFWETLGQSPKEQAKLLDIGGPCMVRAAAKNFESVTVLCSPEDYPEFLEELKKHDGATSVEYRKKQAAKAFRLTSQYDAMIAAQWSSSDELPTSLSLSNTQPLRYGENPHQKAYYASTQGSTWSQIQGKELSYNNLLDTEAALQLSLEFQDPCVVIVKHNNPCGVAIGGKDLEGIYRKALQADSKSAFGGIVATNGTLDKATANALCEHFLEVVIAKNISVEAKEILAKKKNLRVLEWDKPNRSSFEMRPALGGWVVQQSDQSSIDPSSLKTVTTHLVEDTTLNDLLFAWLVCKHVRSNAIVIAKDGVNLGIGAGQMSRVDAVELALQKCSDKSLQGSVLASDAFFPFRDNIDLLKETGIKAIIQPGGSLRDNEVIEACNEHGIAMVFTGKRHFRH